MGDLLEQFVDWVFGFVVSLWDIAWTWFKDVNVTILQELWAWVKVALPQSAIDTLNGVDWSFWSDALSDVAWILPVPQMMLILGGAYTTVATIRLVRWILALIPTIGG